MKKFLFVCITAFAFMSCDKKEDDPVVPSLEVTTNNLVGTYKITAATATQAGITVNVLTTYWEECKRDDTYTLTATTSTTGAYNVTDAGMPCTTSSTATGTYSVNTAAKTITINGQTADVVSLTTTTLVISQSNFQGSNATVKITYTKQ